MKNGDEAYINGHIDGFANGYDLALNDVLHVIDKWKDTKDAVKHIRAEVVALRGGEQENE